MSQAVVLVGNTSGPYATPFQKQSVGNTGQVIKASAGQLYSIVASNAGAAVSYLKVYDKATAAVAASDHPVLVIMLPAGGTVPYNIGVLPATFVNGIGVRASLAEVDTDTTAPSGVVTVSGSIQ